MTSPSEKIRPAMVAKHRFLSASSAPASASSAGLTRRRFLQGGSLALGTLAFPFVSRRRVLGANNRLNVAAIGAGGKGGVDIGYCRQENVVALCDVDARNAEGTFKAFPDARVYQDFRRMLDQEKELDAVTISTPDHTHFHAAAQAMQLGRHVYVQKPLTHSVWEARTLTRLARETRVVTQMGNQGHSQPDSRRLVELIQAGVLGDVTEVHVWTDRPIWAQGMGRPESRPVPSHLEWDLWLGPAPWRDFHDGLAPFSWRAFWDFGTGALGDMGCHNMDLAFWALDLRDPLAVSAEFDAYPHQGETAPKASTVTFEFPARGRWGRTRLVWYDGGRKPPAELAGKTELPGNGSLLIGTRDTLYVPSYWGWGEFRSGRTRSDFKEVAEVHPRFPGAETDHDAAQHLEWLAACKGEGRTLGGFDVAGPMTEAILLGNVALRLGKRIQWDAAALRVANAPEAAALIRRTYRAGWEWSA
jgi:predicted dehydrogenase